LVQQRGASQRRRNTLLYLGLFLATAGGFILNIFYFAQAGHYFFTPTEDLAEGFGGGDQGSYLRLAIDLQDFNVQNDNFWILALWPPGTPVVLALFEALPGTLLPYLVFVVALLWSIPPYLLISSSPKSWTLAVAVLSLWTFNPIFHNWLFGTGAFTSEFLGLPIFAASLAFLLRSAISVKPNRDLYFSAALLGLSLYFRATLLPLTMLAFVTVFAVFSISLFFHLRQKTKIVELRTQMENLGTLIAGYFKYGLIVFLVAAPWAVMVFTLVNPGSVSWSANDYLWGQKWTPSEELVSQGGSWLVEGGANWPCILNPAQCSALGSETMGRQDFQAAQNAAMKTLFSNPGEFLRLRLENLIYAFPSLPGSTIGYNQSPVTLVSYALFFTTYLVALLRVQEENFRARLAVNLVFAVSLIVSLASFAILAVYHIETRYFLPGHIVALLASGFFASLILRNSTAPLSRIKSD
jgi:hypothetical protein